MREFRCFTADLHALATWLESCGIETVAMESTGVFWVPLYEILQERGFEVLLVNAQHVKGVPGRKSDIQDCQWIQQLHTFGLLRGSFRPDAEIVALRSLMRHRDQLVKSAASYIQRMQKSMVLMNLHLHNVLSDISGVTGLAILRDIVAGEASPEVLAQHRDPRCKSSEEEIAASLTGHYKPELVFVLKQCLELYDEYQEQITRCDAQAEELLHSLERQSDPIEAELPTLQKRTHRKANEPRFDIRSPLFRICGGSDLATLPGIGPYNALRLISEIGTDMSRWKTEKHFTSWLTLSSNNRISGGKLLSSRTQPSANRAAMILRMSAQSLSRSDHQLGAFYRRLAARIGKPKALTATARKLAILIYRMLKDGLVYKEMTAADYDQRLKDKIIKGLKRKAKSLGLELIHPETGVLA